MRAIVAHLLKMCATDALRLWAVKIMINDVQLEDEFDPFAVVLLIRWLQNNVQKPDGESHTLEQIAEDILGTTRHSLNRFLQQKLNRGDEEQVKARDYAIKLNPVLEQGRPFPPAVRKLYKSVYGDDMFVDLGESNPVQLPEVLRHRSMGHVPLEPADITPLTGLSALVRRSEDYVAAPELGDEAVLPGWSISLLHVVPGHVQQGLNHPLFVLHQRGLSNDSSLTVEGIVVTQDDRFVLQGVDIVQRRPFHAYLSIPDQWRNYRDNDPKQPITASGLMMGLSGGRTVFAGRFDLFAIPDTTIPVIATASQITAFDDRYQQIKQNSIGVRNLDGTVAELKALGIGSEEDWFKETLRNMRDRESGSPLLKP